MKTLALIPARAGSKGVPGKNTRLFCGLPLIAWAINVGLETCDRTVVSTDGEDISALAWQYGVGVVIRPAELATDEAPMLPVIQHALAAEEDKPDVVVLLQPTSPLRTAENVRAALRLLEEQDATSVVSLRPIPAHMSPDYAVRLVDGRWVAPATRLTRRQDCRPAYYRDGTVYAIRRWVIEEGDLYGSMPVPLIIPAAESCTIDTEADWLAAEAKHAEVR